MSDQYPDPPTEVAALEPEALARRLAAGDPVRLLDVRDREEVERWQIDGPSVTQTTIPYAKFMAAKVQDTVGELAAEIAGEGPITVVCGQGEASDFVAGLLTEAGVEAQNLAGGMDAWAQVYVARPIREDPTVVQYQRPSSGCLSYVVTSDGEAVVVDPLRAFTDRYIADAEERGVEIVAVVDTHVHADHVSGLRELADATDARAIVPEQSVERGITDEVETVTDGEEIAVGETTLRAVALPGHTTGMTGFAIADVLLAGDSVFLEGVARPDLQDGTDRAAMARELHATLTERLATFDDETVLAPGHYDEGTDPAPDGTYTAPLGSVRERLAAVERDRDAFVARVTGELGAQPANADRIVAINLGTESVADDAALELELGPNNCAAAD